MLLLASPGLRRLAGKQRMTPLGKLPFIPFDGNCPTISLLCRGYTREEGKLCPAQALFVVLSISNPGSISQDQQTEI